MDIILNILFIITLVILLPLGEVARIDVANNIAIIGVDVAVFLLSFLLLLKIIILRQKLQGMLMKPLLLFAVVCVGSLLINSFGLQINKTLTAFLYLVRWVAYTGVYFYIIQLKPEYKKKIPLYLLLSGCFVLIIGYLQFFLYPNLRNLAYLGWDVHLYRLFGSFLDPNFIGAFLVLYFLFVLWLLVIGQSDVLFARLPRFARNDVMRRVGLFLILFLSFLGILLTYSRSAYSMLGIGILSFFIFKKPSKKIIVGSVIILLVAAIVVGVKTRASEGTNLLRVTSTKARLTSSQNALFIFEKNPIIGVGFDAYRYAQERYKLIDESKNIVSIDHAGAGTDNSFLFVLATTGIIGFLAYAYLWVSILTQNKFRFRNIATLLYCYIVGSRNQVIYQKFKKIILNPLVVSSSLALFVDSFFINSLFYPFIMLWMLVVIGFTENT